MFYKIYIVGLIQGDGFLLDEKGEIVSMKSDIYLPDMYYVEIWQDEQHMIMHEPFKEFSQAKEWAEEQIEIYGE